jgi:Mn2+/Fe2+ NRAMP family transporter/sporulation protein YlmC with PRC-barrel domain
MGAAVKLLVGGPALLYVVLFAVLSAGLQIFTRYARYVSILKWGCLALFSYVICAFVVHVSWGQVARAIVWPPLSFKADYLMAVVAVFGTTISPYLFFWQAGNEVEETKEDAVARPLTRAPEQAGGEFTRIRIDTYIGMGISNLVALFIVITTAATLNATGVTDIQTSAQAAEALRAVAGPLTFAVFAAGIIGTGMLALPALAGSAAYALGETFSWHVGLARLPLRAKAFYATIAVGMVLGVALNFTPIDPIKALYWRRGQIMRKIITATVLVMGISIAAQAYAQPAQILTRLPAGTTVTNFYKQNVYDPSNDTIGTIDDVLISTEGRVSALIVGVGGFLGIGEKDVAIPFRAIQASRKDNAWVLVLNTTKDASKAAPGFTYDKTTTTWVPAVSK